MELRQVQYFICLFEEGTVTQAARRLNIVQPALSMQIAKLEDELGQKLFERSSQGMEPTAAGRQMYQLFLPIVKDFHRARETLLQVDGELSGHINVGLVASIAQGVLADALRLLNEQHPMVRVTVADGYSALLADWVTNGQLDAALINKPRRPLGLTIEPVAKETMVLLTGPAFDVDLPDRVSCATVCGLELVLPTRRHGLRGVLESYTQSAGLELSPSLETDSLATIVQLVETTRFATILPPIAAQASLDSGRVRAHAIRAPRLVREVVCVTHPRRPMGPACMAFIHILSALLRDRPPQA